jgi:hypothetical protein
MDGQVGKEVVALAFATDDTRSLGQIERWLQQPKHNELGHLVGDAYKETLRFAGNAAYGSLQFLSGRKDVIGVREDDDAEFGQRQAAARLPKELVP